MCSWTTLIISHSGILPCNELAEWWPPSSPLPPSSSLLSLRCASACGTRCQVSLSAPTTRGVRVATVPPPQPHRPCFFVRGAVACFMIPSGLAIEYPLGLLLCGCMEFVVDMSLLCALGPLAGVCDGAEASAACLDARGRKLMVGDTAGKTMVRVRCAFPHPVQPPSTPLESPSSPIYVPQCPANTPKPPQTCFIRIVQR